METIDTSHSRLWPEYISKLQPEEGEAEAKKLAAEYSLGLIKASMDHLADAESADPEKMRSAMKELVHAGKVRKYPCSNEMLKELIKDHERIMGDLKRNMSNYYERFKDGRIVEVIKNVIEEHKTIAWILKRHMVR